MRVSTAFNRLLQIPGATVIEVVFGEHDVEVSLRPRARLLSCPCGKRMRAVYDRRRRRWRHLDLACRRLWLVYEIRRLDCPDCGVITEELPWAPMPMVMRLVMSKPWSSKESGYSESVSSSTLAM